LETGSTLLSLVLELRVQGIINHEALVHSQLTGHSNKIAHSLVQVGELGDLRLGKDQLLQVVQLGTQAKVLMS
jgi:hypothetical protein